MNRNNNTKKLIINALLLAIGAILHQITPVLGLPMQPDFSLAMLFIIMIINKGDYKMSLVAGVVTGVFSALTTKFPGGQIPNVIDKIVAMNFVYILIFIICKFKCLNKLKEDKRNYIIAAIILPIGTLISGVIFLVSSQILVGLPASFMALFITIVLPTTVINLIAGVFLLKLINISLKKLVYVK